MHYTGIYSALCGDSGMAAFCSGTCRAIDCGGLRKGSVRESLETLMQGGALMTTEFPFTPESPAFPLKSGFPELSLHQSLQRSPLNWGSQNSPYFRVPNIPTKSGFPELLLHQSLQSSILQCKGETLETLMYRGLYEI